MTNYDRIKAKIANVSIDELSKLLSNSDDCEKICAYTKDGKCNSFKYDDKGSCVDGVKQWLESEASKMTNKEAIENYKYDRAIILIRRIKTEETHEREVDRHKGFDLAISALEKQMPKKVNISLKGTTGWNTKCHCPNCHSMVSRGKYCSNCGQALDWSDTE